MHIICNEKMNKDMVKSFIHSHQHAMSLCVICLLTVCAFLPSFLPSGTDSRWSGMTSGW